MPSGITFIHHAAERAQRYDVPNDDIADAILFEHPRRRRNRGSAGWRVRRGQLVVLYEWRDAGDPTTARVVTLWTTS